MRVRIVARYDERLGQIGVVVGHNCRGALYVRFADGLVLAYGEIALRRIDARSAGIVGRYFARVRVRC